MKLEERALFGLPIETPYGNFQPLSVYDYMDRGSELTAVAFDKKRVLHEFRLAQDEKIRNSEEMTNFLKEVNEKASLKDIVTTYMSIYFAAYVEILALCKYKDIEDREERITTAQIELVEADDETFDSIRKILLEINAQSEQTAFLDPVLQRKKEQGIKFKSDSKDGESSAPTASTLVASIVTYTGLNFAEVVKLNVTQLLHLFQRIQLFIGYDTTTLFATVAGDKVEMIPWSKNIETENDSNTSESFAMSYEKFTSDLDSKLS